MFREIRTAEKNLGLNVKEQKVKEQKFLNIKPEKELTKEELENEIAIIFNEIANNQTSKG